MARNEAKKNVQARADTETGDAVHNDEVGAEAGADYDAAYEHAAAGRIAEAEAICRKILTSDPTHAEALNLLGAIAAKSGNASSAIKLFDRALAVKPDFTKAHNNLGNALIMSGRFGDAAKAFERALQLEPENVLVYDNLGPYERYLDAKVERLDKGKESEKGRKQIQAAMAEALREHYRNKRSLPEEMAVDLYSAMRDVAEGFKNPLFQPVRGRGSQGRQPTEKSCIGDAVLYLRAVEASIIDDKHPVKTVHEAFGGSDICGGAGLARRTIEQWKNDERFAYVKPEGYEPKLIKAKLRFSGSFYSRQFSKMGRGVKHES